MYVFHFFLGHTLFVFFLATPCSEIYSHANNSLIRLLTDEFLLCREQKYWKTALLCWATAAREKDMRSRTDKSTTLAVILSCFDLRALPFGSDINILKLDMFLYFCTLFNTLRTITSDTVGMVNDEVREEEEDRRW